MVKNGKKFQTWLTWLKWSKVVKHFQKLSNCQKFSNYQKIVQNGPNWSKVARPTKMPLTCPLFWVF